MAGFGAAQGFDLFVQRTQPVAGRRAVAGWPLDAGAFRDCRRSFDRQRDQPVRHVDDRNGGVDPFVIGAVVIDARRHRDAAVIALDVDAGRDDAVDRPDPDSGAGVPEVSVQTSAWRASCQGWRQRAMSGFELFQFWLAVVGVTAGAGVSVDHGNGDMNARQESGAGADPGLRPTFEIVLDPFRIIGCAPWRVAELL